jgi:hypothetical protein
MHICERPLPNGSRGRYGAPLCALWQYGARGLPSPPPPPPPPPSPSPPPPLYIILTVHLRIEESSSTQFTIPFFECRRRQCPCPLDALQRNLVQFSCRCLETLGFGCTRVLLPFTTASLHAPRVRCAHMRRGGGRQLMCVGQLACAHARQSSAHAPCVTPPSTCRRIGWYPFRIRPAVRCCFLLWTEAVLYIAGSAGRWAETCPRLPPI